MSEQDQNTAAGAQDATEGSADDVQGHGRMRSTEDQDDVQGHGRMRSTEDQDDDVEGHMRH